MTEAMVYPDRDLAHETLRWAETRNPGKWIKHCETAGDAAFRIASHVPGMDPERAYVSCLLHDIGRYVGIVRARHQIAGYEFCMERGWTAVARICLTHTYPIRDLKRYNEYWDITPEEKQFLADYIASAEYDDYDRLGQLIDYLSLPTGFCILEKRIVDVGRRHGVDATAVDRWNRLFDLKDYFDKRTGGNVYDLLPGIAENSVRS